MCTCYAHIWPEAQTQQQHSTMSLTEYFQNNTVYTPVLLSQAPAIALCVHVPVSPQPAILAAGTFPAYVLVNAVQVTIALMKVRHGSKSIQHGRVVVHGSGQGVAGSDHALRSQHILALHLSWCQHTQDLQAAACNLV